MSTENKITPEQATQKLQDFLVAVGSLSAMLEHAQLIQQAKSIADADIFRLTLDDCCYLIKTYIDRPWFIRWLIGRRCLRNEFDKLRLVQSLETVRAPKPYALLGKDTIAIEFLRDAKPLKTPESMPADRFPTSDFFLELADMLKTMHDAGISHGDMRRANILVDSEVRPYLIDFATAVQSSKKSPPWRRLASRLFTNSDNFSFAKITESFYPGLLSEQVLECYNNPPWYLRLGRYLRHNIYRRYLRTSK
ncbi:MAG: RIO1 family regulatory kinase/ATPase [Lentisphaeria bacterium]|jgi:tRNA A-37 threonylcarbamoyl transferase component Bud32